MSIFREQFKKTLGQFVTGVTIVTAITTDGEPIGMTVNSLTSVSLNPPLILFCLKKNARLADIFLNIKYFAVNVLTADQQGASNAFALGDAKKWEKVKWRLSEHYEIPYLLNTQAYILAKRKEVYDGGDHHIILGEVKELSYNDAQAPLLYFQGQYTHL